jgi:transcriptional regulator with XRE-family HTH domain
MDDELARAFGERARFARQSNHQTQAVVAGLSGITTDYLYQIERGKKLPALPVAMQLANVLRVPLAALLGDVSPASQSMAPREAGDAIHRALTVPRQDTAPLEPTDLPGQVQDAWYTSYPP